MLVDKLNFSLSGLDTPYVFVYGHTIHLFGEILT